MHNPTVARSAVAPDIRNQVSLHRVSGKAVPVSWYFPNCVYHVSICTACISAIGRGSWEKLCVDRSAGLMPLQTMCSYNASLRAVHLVLPANFCMSQTYLTPLMLICTLCAPKPIVTLRQNDKTGPL